MDGGAEQTCGELGADHGEVLSDGGGLRVERRSGCNPGVEVRRPADERDAEGTSAELEKAGTVTGDGGSVGISV